MSQPTLDGSRALWRRQAVLTALAVVAFGGVAGVTKVALSDWARSPSNKAEFLALAVIIGVAVLLLLGAVCVHAVRIAQTLVARSPDIQPSTFRRGETD